MVYDYYRIIIAVITLPTVVYGFLHLCRGRVKNARRLTHASVKSTAFCGVCVQSDTRRTMGRLRAYVHKFNILYKNAIITDTSAPREKKSDCSSGKPGSQSVVVQK